MNKPWFKKFWPCDFTYYTELSIPECMEAICSKPHVFGRDPYNFERYECEKLTDTLVSITFRGTQFGKFIHTDYLAELNPCSDKTEIIIRFQKEAIGLIPCISTYHLDIFIEQKVRGWRVNTSLNDKKYI